MMAKKGNDQEEAEAKDKSGMEMYAPDGDRWNSGRKGQ